MAGPYTQEFLAASFPDLTDFQFVATGGQKSVYLAKHAAHHVIALKIFNLGSNNVRFEREIAAVSGIACDKIPRIYSHGALAADKGGNLWLLEQWIEGESLRSRIDAGGVANPVILQIALDILSVLKDAENAKIVHRDVKPENILVAADGAKCWLIDFGIARHLERTTLTQGPWGVFSCGYSPPEQFKNFRAEIDARADLFALGVTLHECVEGTNLFRSGAENNDQILKRVETISLPPLSRRVDARGEFADLVTAMTRSKRMHRISTAAEAYAWMEEIAKGGVA